MKLFIGSSSNENIPGKYTNDCKELLEVILKDNDLIFGSYNKGLMGLSYDIAKKYNRKVTGICPRIYESSLNDLDCDDYEITDTMLDSTLKIYQISDAIIFLPGGFGTIYEFFTANFSKISKDLNLPIILYNSCGYFDKLLDFIEEMSNNGFLRDTEKGMFVVANTPEEVLNALERR